ncbi:transposase IS200 like protein [Clostridium homopropionicum DSM 5847]|uniref:Transposase IS200 like protein n=1 Tax=Clostridium homopropionicum DSM 5847 TaxID=1121318 RepID=A0A0L6Z7L1_9CLOT|nr:transposase [Clostridium homopropionicum]KOA18957.1 transposase IS200 like protein [Clostridium homopropionicum DSM 5847]SFG43451.1 REP element-mobilizing transposase RayT [Clostridium homopropionicum]
MPRTARQRSSSGIYHVMMRSISDIKLFRNVIDKEVFLKFLKKYKESFLFNIYSYCIMDTHVHLVINSNGADVSKFMHNINQCYAQYYNKKYNRTGHVFGDRFKSTVATSDISVLSMTAYVHNNPKDIKGYRNCVENYNYSSFNIYLGRCTDKYNLIDRNFILSYFHSDPILAAKHYYSFVKSRQSCDFTDLEITNPALLSSNKAASERTYTKPIIRNIHPKKIIEFISKYTNFDKSIINIKYRSASSEFRSLCAFFMRLFCNYNSDKIQKALGNNISLSSIPLLCNKGYSLIKDNISYHNIIDDFVNSSSYEAI